MISYVLIFSMKRPQDILSTFLNACTTTANDFKNGKKWDILFLSNFTPFPEHINFNVYLLLEFSVCDLNFFIFGFHVYVPYFYVSQKPSFLFYFLLYTFSYKIVSSLFFLRSCNIFLLIYIYWSSSLFLFQPFFMFDCFKWYMGLWEKLVSKIKVFQAVEEPQYGQSQSEKKLGVHDKYHRSIKVHT